MNLYILDKLLVFIQTIYKHDAKELDKVLNTGRYTPECLTERDQLKHVSALVVTENKTAILCL